MLRTPLPPSHTQAVSPPTRTLGALGVALALLASVSACRRSEGDSAIEESDALSLREIRAIQHLMLFLRGTEGTVHGADDEPMTTEQAATAFEGRLEDAGDRVRSAEDFIAYIASSNPETGVAVEIEFEDGTRQSMGPWLSGELLVYRYPKPITDPPIPDLPPPDAEIRLALEIVENSGLDFISHTGPKGETETIYDGLRFSRMLNRKWDWLGHGMQDFDEWIGEIGASSFKSTIPYEVEIEPGNRVPFEPWLRREMARRADEEEQAKAAEEKAELAELAETTGDQAPETDTEEPTDPAEQEEHADDAE